MDHEAERRAHLRARLERALDEVAVTVEGRTGVKAREVRAKVRSYRRVLTYWTAVVPTHAQERALEELVGQLRDAKRWFPDAVSGVRRLDGSQASVSDAPAVDRVTKR